jgi:hypothetical protein
MASERVWRVPGLSVGGDGNKYPGGPFLVLRLRPRSFFRPRRSTLTRPLFTSSATAVAAARC